MREALVQLNSSKCIHFGDCPEVSETKLEAEKKTRKRTYSSRGSRTSANNRYGKCLRGDDDSVNLRTF